MSLFNKIYSLTKEPFGYLASLTEIGILLFIAVSWLKTNPLNLSRETLAIAFILLIALLVFRIKKIYYEIRYRLSVKSLDYQLDRASGHHAKNSIYYDYDKLIPSKNILEHLLNAYKRKALVWSPDSIFVGTNLSISNKYTKNNKMRINVQYKFYSPVKRLSIDFEGPGMKMLEYKKIKQSQLHHSEHGSKVKPFFEDPNWRQALIIAFQRVEAELIGKLFSMSVSDEIYTMWVQFMPESPISKSFVYIYADQKLKEGYIEPKVIKDFSKEV